MDAENSLQYSMLYDKVRCEPIQQYHCLFWSFIGKGVNRSSSSSELVNISTTYKLDKDEASYKAIHFIFDNDMASKWSEDSSVWGNT